MHGTRTRASGGASAALGSRRITVQDEEQQCLGKHKGYRGISSASGCTERYSGTNKEALFYGGGGVGELALVPGQFALFEPLSRGGVLPGRGGL